MRIIKNLNSLEEVFQKIYNQKNFEKLIRTSKPLIVYNLKDNDVLVIDRRVNSDNSFKGEPHVVTVAEAKGRKLLHDDCGTVSVRFYLKEFPDEKITKNLKIIWNSDDICDYMHRGL